MEFSTLITRRYSCKKYADTPVPREVIEKILHAGLVAPTAKNLQEQHVYVLTTPEDLALVDELTPCRYGAPVVLVVAFDAENVFVYPGGERDSGVEDASIVTTHMMLAAANEGVESCWLNNFNPALAKAKLGLPENQEVLALLDLGYAAPGAGPLANHTASKTLEETVTWR